MLLPARDIFKLIDETIQKNKGPQSYEKFDKEVECRRCYISSENIEKNIQ